MIVHQRLRSFIFPTVLFALSTSIAGYFVWHAINGQRGILAKEQFRAQMETLVVERQSLVAEKTAIERRIAMLRGGTIDRELLDEQARKVLGRTHPSDVVIFLDRANSRIGTK